jgi:hypothetical protein
MRMKVPSTTTLSFPTLSPLLTAGKNIVGYFLDSPRIVVVVIIIIIIIIIIALSMTSSRGPFRSQYYHPEVSSLVFLNSFSLLVGI